MAINFSGLASGISSRIHEHQLMEYQDEQARRREYIDHLGKMHDAVPDADTKKWISDEVGNVLSRSPDKPLKPRSIPPPERAQSEEQRAGASGGPSASATPPPLDAKALLDHLSAQQAASAGGGGGGMAGQGGLPPVAATPPGHNLPAPAPIVGTLPGQPMLSQPPTQSQGAQGPPPVPMSATPPPITLSSAGGGLPMGGGYGAHGMSPFPGMIDRASLEGQAAAAKARPMYDLNRQYGLGATGKPMVTMKDRIDAAKVGYKQTIDPQTGMPVLTQMSPAEYGPILQAKMGLQGAQTRRQDAQARLDDAKARGEPQKVAIMADRLRLMDRGLDLRSRSLDMMAERLTFTGMKTYGQLYGTDMSGAPLPGAIEIHNADGTFSPVGTLNAPNVRMPAATRVKAEAANAAIAHGEHMIQFTLDPANEDMFGKFAGRWDQFMARKVGTNDPRSAGLIADMESMASLLAPVHGFRAVTAKEEFMKALNRADSPEAFAAAIESYTAMAAIIHQHGENAVADRNGRLTLSDGSQWAQDANGVPVRTKPGSGGAPYSAPAPSAGGASATPPQIGATPPRIGAGAGAGGGSGAGSSAPPIIQRSRSTGATRYSPDGGKTWQAGLPPSP